MTWCPCVHNLQSFCSVHAPTLPAEAEKVLKLERSRARWRAYAERLEKQVEKLRFVEFKYTVTSAPLYEPGRVLTYIGEPVSEIYEEREKLKLEREDERKNPSMVLGPMTAGELQARKELGEARAEMYRLRDERDGWMERHEKAMECNRQLSALIDEERAATQAEIRLLRTRARCRRLFGSTITAGPHAGEGAKRCTLELGHLGPCGAFP